MNHYQRAVLVTAFGTMLVPMIAMAQIAPTAQSKSGKPPSETVIMPRGLVIATLQVLTAVRTLHPDLSNTSVTAIANDTMACLSSNNNNSALVNDQDQCPEVTKALKDAVVEAKEATADKDKLAKAKTDVVKTPNESLPEDSSTLPPLSPNTSLPADK